MKSILIAAVIGLAFSILFTPTLIKWFTTIGLGQEIREELAETHKNKRGTPTMGGIAIVLAMWVGYLGTVLINKITGAGGWPTASAWLLLYLTTGLGLVGFLDDFIKLRNRRNLGLNKRMKLIGQTFVAVSFAIGSLAFRDSRGLTPASTHFSYTRDLAFLSLGAVGFVVIACLLISAWSNAVNLTDGLDGLAAGSSVMVLGSYVFICFFQFRKTCSSVVTAGCYEVRDPLDIAVVAAAALGGCIGFLWWNAHPARIFMGDIGSLALGGLIAGLSILSRTELLLVVIAGLPVIEMLSVVIQVAVFKTRHRRVFKITPIHHHFEQSWPETTVLIRFWLLAALAAALGLGLFYADWLSVSGT